jgi:hypothetical protein
VILHDRSIVKEIHEESEFSDVANESTGEFCSNIAVSPCICRSRDIDAIKGNSVESARFKKD